ncbi:MAG TPA: response regulator transcription factor [Blastocatellia bacterium]|nr:response regulator transcription factor [Blastocatellia bacterium]
MKLLIVEDNAQMRRLIRSVVADLAEAITECGDGDEVVAAYSNAQFSATDRVLMDLHMPRVNGLEAMHQLRRAFPDAHIIVVTQDDTRRARRAVLEAGACGYVLKDNLLELREMLQAP